MYQDISAFTPEESFMRFKEFNSERRPSAEWLAKKKKLRDAWLTSQHKTTTTTTTAPPSDRSSTILFIVLGFLALITLVVRVSFANTFFQSICELFEIRFKMFSAIIIISAQTWAVKRNAVKQRRKRDREVQEHQELLEQSIRSRSLLLEIEN
ncbi:hypothetical protein RB195_023321 [Necator americanus]|uniref:Uncharacterized protein n=1 Tax=Necator americanus TaxID=51031 RepID=A0ABR1EIV0_NECAM